MDEVALELLYLRMVDFAFLENIVSLQRQRPPFILCVFVW